jgi:hypothetical protein
MGSARTPGLRPALRVRTVAGVAAAAVVCAGTSVLSSMPASASAPPVHGLGVVRSPGMTSSPTLGTQALSVVATTTTAVPASVDLSRFDPKVADQGAVNSCAAWAIGYGMLGWFGNSQGHTGAPYAPMYAYSQLSGRTDSGSSPAAVLEVLRTQGIDTTVKYGPGHGGPYWSYFDWTHKPTAAEKTAATPNRIAGWVTLYNTFGSPGATAVAKIKQTLAGGRPVALTIGVFNRFEQASGPAVISSTGNLGPLLGLHEVLAVGYDSRGVKIMNSWGTYWGNAGYAILDWNYIAQFSYEAETAAGFAATSAANRPTVTAVAPASGTVRGGQTVTLTGTNLVNAIVSIGGQSVLPLSVTSDHKHLTFRTPAAPAGLDALRVSTPAGVSAQATTYRFVN